MGAGAFLIAAGVCVLVGIWMSREIWYPGAHDDNVNKDQVAGGTILILMTNVFTGAANAFSTSSWGFFGFWFSIVGATVAIIALMKWAPTPTEHLAEHASQ